jgi:SAM-dependent methyltransferase
MTVAELEMTHAEAFAERMIDVLAGVGLLDHLLPVVPGLGELLERGIDVLDLGCGQGRALCLMAQSFPRSSFTGYDPSLGEIGQARASAELLGLTNISFAVLDAAELVEEARYDLICTFDALCGKEGPAGALAKIARALKPDGIYLMQDSCSGTALAVGDAAPSANLALDLLETGFRQVEVYQLPYDAEDTYYVARK